MNIIPLWLGGMVSDPCMIFYAGEKSRKVYIIDTHKCDTAYAISYSNLINLILVHLYKNFQSILKLCFLMLSQLETRPLIFLIYCKRMLT